MSMILISVAYFWNLWSASNPLLAVSNGNPILRMYIIKSCRQVSIIKYRCGVLRYHLEVDLIVVH